MAYITAKCKNVWSLKSVVNGSYRAEEYEAPYRERDPPGAMAHAGPTKTMGDYGWSMNFGTSTKRDTVSEPIYKFNNF